ncbi:MAG: DUF4426 domain-containing protein [Gammaproteobacteria bacterium]|nr:DUF4426 domain-containing protein [Gammaproteobacteria bacterium]
MESKKSDFCNKRVLLAACAVCLVFSASPQAEIRKITDGLELHYNALLSTDIPAQVMKSYGLKRSKNLGLLNLSLVSYAPDPMGGPALRNGIKAQAVSCTSTNLNKQQRELDIQAVKSGEAVYHLALFPIESGDNIDFSCSLTIPEGIADDLSPQDRVLSVEFSKGFFTSPD